MKTCRATPAWLGGVLCCVLAACAPARAQLLHMDPLPYQAASDSTSRLALQVDLDRFTDPKFDWNVNRVLVTVILPAGETASFFLRGSQLTFDAGETPLGSRWPWVLGADGQDGWPHERRVSGFGRLEVGVTGPAALPLLHGVDYGFALGLPTGNNRTYPFSARSIPLRLQLRKAVLTGTGWQARLRGGYLVHMDSGGEELEATAFPGGYGMGASLAGFGRRGARWQLGWDYRSEESRRSQVVSLQGWLPWTADGAVGLRVGRELQGSLDRGAAWYFSLSWRFDSPRYRPGAGDESAATR